ncbi:MAG: adenylyltransferase/cytidyltransferase family protein [Candidatus Woesearchaeota archaeon]
MNKVMCFGTFDILHLGHLNYFQQAKEYGDYLIVAVARDKTKNRQKVNTIFNEEERLQILQNLKIVDEAILGDEEDYFKIILDEKPDVICLGYDHKITERELKEKLSFLGFEVEIKRMKPFIEKKYKSSLIRKVN